MSTRTKDVTYRFDTSYPSSASHNLIVDIETSCGEESSLTSYLISASLILGMFVGSLLLTCLADFNGRRNINIGFSFGFIIALASLLAAQYFEGGYRTVLIVAVVTGITIAPKVSVSLIYALELMSHANLKGITAVGFLVSAVVAGLLALLIYATEMYTFMLVIILLEILTMLPVIFLLPESPYYSFKRGNSKQFYAAILKIA